MPEIKMTYDAQQRFSHSQAIQKEINSVHLFFEALPNPITQWRIYPLF
jgi:hypothetical protein